MPQQPVEVILMRQLASYLATPIFVVDPDGRLLYYNEPAELMLGRRFEDVGEMPLEEWTRVFEPTDEDGRPLPPEQLPLVVALRERRPVSRGLWISGLDGVARKIQLTAIPLEGLAQRNLGAVAIFWGDDRA